MKYGMDISMDHVKISFDMVTTPHDFLDYYHAQPPYRDSLGSVWGDWVINGHFDGLGNLQVNTLPKWWIPVM